MADASAPSWAEVPRGFVLCLSSGCPAAARCLRRAAAGAVPPPPDGPCDVTVVNPACAALAQEAAAAGARPEEACHAFLPSEPVRMARGFRKAHGSVPAERYGEVKTRLTQKMGKSNFYRWRRGDCLLSPANQELVRSVLRGLGAPEPIEFDAYEEARDWHLNIY